MVHLPQYVERTAGLPRLSGTPIHGERDRALVIPSEGFTIGSTQFYDAATSAGSAAIDRKFRELSTPTMVRLVGGISTEKHAERLTYALAAAFLEFGAPGGLSSCGTESRSATDLNRILASIPAVGLRLIRMMNAGCFPGDMKFYGSIPGGGTLRETPFGVEVHSSSRNVVHAPHELSEAFYFTGRQATNWMNEAEGMAETFDRNLRLDPNLRVLSLFHGNGPGSKLEMQLMLELAQKFEGRVFPVALLGTAGVEGSVGRKFLSQGGIALPPSPQGMKFAVQALNHGINGHRNPFMIPDSAGRFINAIEGRLRLGGIEIAMPHAGRFKPALRALQGMAVVASIETFEKLKPSEREAVRSFLRRTAGDLSRAEMRAYSRTTPIDQTIGLGLIAKTGAVILDRGIRSPRSPDPLAEAISRLDPARRLPEGAIILHPEHRLVRTKDCDGRQVLVSADGRMVSPDALLGTSIESGNAVKDELLNKVRVARIPENPPVWQNLPAGTVIRYFDRSETLIAHEELLHVGAAQDGDRALPQYVAAVTSILVDRRTGETTAIHGNREEVDLVLPPDRIGGCHRVEVLRALERTDLPEPVPTGHVARNSTWDTAGITQKSGTLLTGILRQVEHHLVTLSGRETARAGELLDERSIAGLLGRDPAFELRLEGWKELREGVVLVGDLLRPWLGSACVEGPPTTRARLASLLDVGGSGTLLERASALVSVTEAIREAHPPRYASQLGGLTAAVETLARALRELDPLPERQRSELEYFRDGSAPREVVDRCAEIASARRVSTDPAQRREELERGGGFLLDKFTPAYFKLGLQQGGILVVHRERDTITGFALVFPAGRVPLDLRQLFGDQDWKSTGVFDLRAQESAASFTTSVALSRATFLLLAGSETKTVVAIIHESNKPSQRVALRDGYQMSPFARVRYFAGVEDTCYLVCAAQTDATVRGALPMPIPASGTRPAPLTPERLGFLEEGFLVARASEREQMDAIRARTGDLALNHFSFGVGSMSPEARALLQRAIRAGVFDEFEGVITGTASFEVELVGGVFKVRDTGAHELLGELYGRMEDRAFAVGFIPVDGQDQRAGMVVEVLHPDGVVRQHEVVKTSVVPDRARGIEGGESADRLPDGTVLQVADLGHDRRIKFLLHQSENNPDKLRTWHLSSLRASEFASRYQFSRFLFGAGGSVVTWEIQRLVKESQASPDRPQHLVLVKGLGGAVDKILNDDAMRNELLADSASRRFPYIRVIDLTKMPELGTGA